MTISNCYTTSLDNKQLCDLIVYANIINNPFFSRIFVEKISVLTIFKNKLTLGFLTVKKIKWEKS